jgi:hypothetical protein
MARQLGAGAAPRPAAPHPGGAPRGSLEQAPPFALPGEHFAAALGWLALGAAGLVVVAPDLARGGMFDPRAVAVAHCFTLGWITTSIFGALYQLFPVALGVPARSVQAGHRTFWALQAGVATLVAGTWFWVPGLLVVAWVLLAAAVGGLAWNLLPQRRRAPRGRVIGRYVSAAHMALGLAMFVVLARIGAEFGLWDVERLGFLAAHVHLAAVGFATFTAMGVGSRLFPMFLLAHGHAERPLAWLGPVAGAGLVALAAGELAAVRPLALAGGTVLAAGLAGYVALVRDYYRHRVRRRLEPGTAAAALAVTFLAAAVALGLWVLWRPGFDPRLAAAYGITGLAGWLTLLVAGMYQKIVPFLIWLHRFSARVGEPGVPRIADLTLPALGWAVAGCAGAGAAITAAGVGAGLPAVARIGAGAFAAGVAALVAQMERAWTRG